MPSGGPLMKVSTPIEDAVTECHLAFSAYQARLHAEKELWIQGYMEPKWFDRLLRRPAPSYHAAQAALQDMQQRSRESGFYLTAALGSMERWEDRAAQVIDLLKALVYAQGLGATHAEFSTREIELLSFR